MKIMIALATFNRPVITDICLKNLSAFRLRTHCVIARRARLRR